MDLKNLVEVGKVNKPHGVRGILKVTFDVPLSSFTGVPFQAIFIGKGATQIPHFVAACDDLGDGNCLLTLEEVDSREKALSFSNKALFVTNDVFEQAFEADDEDDFDIVGYTLIDQDDNIIGEIVEVVEYPSQDMAMVMHNGQEVLIPIIDDLIIVIDDDKLIIQMEIPEGLIELNKK